MSAGSGSLPTIKHAGGDGLVGGGIAPQPEVIERLRGRDALVLEGLQRGDGGAAAFQRVVGDDRQAPAGSQPIQIGGEGFLREDVVLDQRLAGGFDRLRVDEIQVDQVVVVAAALDERAGIALDQIDLRQIEHAAVVIGEFARRRRPPPG